MALRVIMALVAVWLTGCASVNSVLRSGAKVESIEMSARAPGQVAVMLTAETGGEPLDRLMSSSFKIYEDGQLVAPSTSKQTLLDPGTVTSFHTMLLLDLGGDAAIPQNRTAIARATATFVELVRRTQPVTVYAFDGAPTPVLLGEYPVAANAPPLGAIPEVENFQPRDPSRDLRSSVLAALRELNARLMEDTKPLHTGTLVVFTQGPDNAGRVEEDTFYANVGATKRDVVVVHLDEKPHNEIEQLGNQGLLYLDQLQNAGPVFEGAAIRVGALKDRHYLLSYCSPSRAGKRLLRIDVSGFDKEGSEKRGSVSLEFDSTGFGPGCDANAVPQFGATPPPAASTAGPDPAAAAPPDTSDPDQGIPTEQPAAAPEGTNEAIVPPPDRPGYGD
jgi:hypothetical protein